MRLTCFLPAILLSLALLPNLASGQSDKPVRIQVVPRLTAFETLAGHTTFVHSVTFSPDGKLLASASSGMADDVPALIVYDVEKRRERFRRKVSESTKVRFSPDGKYLAYSYYSGPLQGGLCLYDLNADKERWHANVLPGIFEFTADGRSLFLEQGVQMLVLDADTGRQTHKFRWHPDAGRFGSGGLVVSADGKWFATGDADGEVVLWDAKTRQKKHTLSAGTAKEVGQVYALAFSPDAKTLVAGHARPLVVWDVAAAKERFRHPTPGEDRASMKFRLGSATIQGVAVSPDNKLIAAGDFFGRVLLWESATGRPQTLLEAVVPGKTTYSIRAVAFSPDGKLVAAGQGASVRLWDLAGPRK